jgi:hypothetical protein
MPGQSFAFQTEGLQFIATHKRRGKALIALALLPTSPILMTPVSRKEPHLSLYTFQMHAAQVLYEVLQTMGILSQHHEGAGSKKMTVAHAVEIHPSSLNALQSSEYTPRVTRGHIFCL